MLELADRVEHPDIRTLYLTVEDGVPLSSEKLRQGVDFIRNEYEAGHTVLVACGAGISRSSAFTVAALKEIEGLTLLEAMKAVRDPHPMALPHPKIWDSLTDYYDEDAPFHNALRTGK